MTSRVLALPALFTEAQVAERLGVHPETVARERRRGRLAWINVGSKIRIREDQLAEYLEKAQCGFISETTSPGGKASITSAGQTNLDAHTAHQLAQEITATRKSSSRGSSSSTMSRETSAQNS